MQTPQPTSTSAPPDLAAVNPHIERLKIAISEKNSCSGTRLRDPQNFILYYGEDRSARRLDFTSATEADLSDLSRACDAATFGRGDQDVLDETYRKAGKMDINQFASTFNLSDSGLIEIVRSELLEGENDRKTIKAELYKLNVYSPGAFFKVHKDTPRSEEMFGSLVVILPTHHEGGKLLLRHGQDESEFDSAKAIAEQASPSVAYVAFFSDVEHEVTTVTAGHRITLTYNLYFGSGSEDEIPGVELGPGLAIVPSNESKFRAALTELLSTETFMAEGGKLGFGLSHQYAFARDYNGAVTSNERYSWLAESTNRRGLERLVHRLKGSDATIFRVCQELSLDAYLRVVYETDYSLMMADHVIDLANYEVDDVESTLRDSGAVVLERYPKPWERKSKKLEKIAKVEWVTKLTPFNRLRTEYIAHGNQADLAYMYGDISMVVDIGKFGERDTRTAAEAARAERENRVPQPKRYRF